MHNDDYNFIVFGHNFNLVLNQIWDRKNRLKKQTNKSNPIRLGLIIEGGGMRGIISGGFLVAIHQLGLTNIFDNVYGTSAGALGGAYFLSEQCPYGVSIFYEDVNNRNFINTRTIPPYLNIDYLMDVVKNRKKLDLIAVKQHRSKLIIAATEVTSGKQRYFSNHEDIDLLKAIKASCALPIYYDKPVQINGEQYLDGGIVSCLPVLKAIKDGCTHLLILMTKEKKRKNTSHLPFWFEKWRMTKYGKKFIEAYYARHIKYQRNIQIIEGQHSNFKNVNIAAIAPLTKTVQVYTTDAQKLKRAYHASYYYLLNLLPAFNK